VRKALKTILKILLGIIGSLLLLVVVLILLLRLPVIQNYVTHRAVSYVSGKTHTRMSIGRLYIGFPKSLVIEQLYAEDDKHDTLLCMDKLEVDINLFALLHNKVEVGGLLLHGVNAHVNRDEFGKFNFNFFISAFTGQAKKPVKPKEKKEIKKPGKPWQITVKKIDLENVRYSYDDKASGLGLSGYVGNLKGLMKTIDISHLDFSGDSLALSDISTRLILSAPAMIKPDTAVSTGPSNLPTIELKKLALHRVDFHMEIRQTGQEYNFNVGQLVALPDTIDLNRHLIKVKSIDLRHTTGAIALMRNTDTISATPALAQTSDTASFGWFIQGGKVKLSDVAFDLDMTNVPHRPSGLDFSHLHLSGVNIDVSNVHYSPTQITGHIANVTVRDQSGLHVHSLRADVLYNDHTIELAALSLITDQSEISRYIKLTYPSLSTLSKNIGALGITSDFQNSHIGISDLLQFVPSLAKQPQLAAEIGRSISISGKITGRVKDFTAMNLVVKAAQQTSIALDGHITGLPNALGATYDVNIKNIHTTQKDISFLAVGVLPSSINIPATLDLSGKVKGSLKNMTAQLALTSSSGNADIDATLQQLNGDTLYTATLHAHELNIGYILKQEKTLGTITMDATLKGQNIATANMKADLTAQIQSIRLEKYNYHGLSLTAGADHDTYKILLDAKDPNLIMQLSSDISMVKDQKSLSLDLNLDCADLYKLQLVKGNMNTDGKLKVSLKGKDMEAFAGMLQFSDITLTNNDRPYRIDSGYISAHKDTNYTAISVRSPILTADLDGVLNIGDLKGALEHQVSRYFSRIDDAHMKLQDTAVEDFKLAVNVLPNPIIKGAFLPGMESFNGINLKADFNNQKHKLNLAASAPEFGYSGYNADSIRANINADSGAMTYGVSFLRLKNKTINLAQTSLKGSVKDSTVFFALKIEDKDSGDKLILGGDIAQDSSKSFVLHIDNKTLTIDNQKWALPGDNGIHYSPTGIYVHDVVLSNSGQSLAVHSATDTGNAPIDVVFTQFQLGTISSIAEKDSALVRGLVNGHVELRNLSHAPAFTSDLHIDNISYKENKVGNLAVKADNLSPNKYSAAVTLAGDDNDVAIKGFYVPDTLGDHISLDMQVRKLNIASIQGFTAGQIRHSKGYIAGAVAVSGTITKPKVDGNIVFKDAGFNIAYINNYLRFPDAGIKIDPQGISFNSFNLEDSLGHKAVIDGRILTSDFKKMIFDLTIRTDQFTVLNTTVHDNPLYFGHVVLTSDITIKGDNTLPIINTNARLVGGSHVTVIIPPSRISVDRGAGVVVLVDTAVGDQAVAVDSIVDAGAFKGIALSANIEVTKETTFKVVVDKTSGDSLTVRGDGVLSFAMDATGKQTLTGTYTLDGGGYRASFQKIIKKEFSIQSGSTIMFNGSPTDAVVDITATYATRAAPINLFSAELANASSEEKNAYNTLLDFKVNLMMKGELLDPTLTFAIDMTDQDKDAFGGAVYAKLNAMNKDPAILNQQVFALLILNSFMSTDILSGGSAPGGTGDAVNSFARSSVNQVLTDQLNALSGRFIKGVDLNFGVQSNDQYATGSTSVQQNTQLSVGLKKQFFNNRLSVEVGTSITVQNNNGALTQTNANTLTGDIAVEYKLTKDGRYSFKAFRQNLYDDVIDGLIYKTGIGVVFTKNYDKFHELFTPVKKDKDIKPVTKN
jgi:translocation and assembly module TamB